MSVSSDVLWGSVLTNRLDGIVEVARSSLDLNLQKERKQGAIEPAFKTISTGWNKQDDTVVL